MGSGPGPESYSSDQGANPYLNMGPGFLPFVVPVISDRPKPSDPLYTSLDDSPELRLISLQLIGPENYNTWAQDLWRALVTNDKDEFINRTVAFPSDERLQRHWCRCNQLV